MKREVTKWKVKDLIDKIKLRPDTLETLPGTKIKVNIEYQRGVVYSQEKQAKVIESILKDFAIPSIVLWKNAEDESYDVIDGKQRLTSIFLFITGNLQINYIGYEKVFYSKISEVDKQTINEYKLPIIIMHGTKDEEHFKHELFEILNTTAEALNKWELLQGSYYGKFLSTFKEEIQDIKNVEIQTDFNIRDKAEPAKARYAGCYKMLKMEIGNDNEIRNFVEKNRENSGSQYYNKNIKDILKECAKLPEPKNIEIYYDIMKEIISDNKKFNEYDNKRNKIISELKTFFNENKYLKLTGNDLKIALYNIFGIECGFVDKDPKRIFTKDDKDELFSIYEAKRKVENGKIRCEKCGRLFELNELQVDHKIPYDLGGRTTLENAQFLCENCNKSKGNR